MSEITCAAGATFARATATPGTASSRCCTTICAGWRSAPARGGRPRLLNATALVHECWLRFADGGGRGIVDRAHFQGDRRARNAP